MNNVGGWRYKPVGNLDVRQKWSFAPSMCLMPLAFVRYGRILTLIVRPPNIIIAVIGTQTDAAAFGMFRFFYRLDSNNGCRRYLPDIAGTLSFTRRAAGQQQWEDLFEISSYSQSYRAGKM